jgi:hypothetical protein
MSADTELREQSRQQAGDSLRHVYPWRLNEDPFLVGSVAWCGHIRTAPWSGRYYEGPASDVCVVCAEMEDHK